MSVGSLLKSTLVISGASAINVLIGIIRAKIFVLIVGPAGLGVMGMLSNIQGVAGAIAGLGLQTLAVQRLSQSAKRPKLFAYLRRLFWISFILQGVAGALMIVLLATPLSDLAFGSDTFSDEILLLSIGVFFSLISVYQFSVLKSLRQISDIAQLIISGTLIGSILALLAVWLFGMSGIILFVIVQPAVNAALGWIYVRKSLEAAPEPPPLSAGRAQFPGFWRKQITISLPYMFGLLLPMLVALVLRSIVLTDLGVEAAGYFHAAWTISFQYIGLLVIAMGTDYYPRLSAVITNQKEASGLVNQQVLVTMVLGGPVLVMLFLCAPLVLQILYSADFLAGTTMLRWQTAANFFYLIATTLSFILLAQNKSVLNFVLALTNNGIFLAVSYLLITQIELDAVGIGYFVGQFINCLVTFYFAYRAIGYRMAQKLITFFLTYTVLFALLLFTMSIDFVLMLGIGIPSVVVLAWLGLRILLQEVDETHPALQRLRRLLRFV